MAQSKRIHTMAKIALLSAVALILMFLEIPMPFTAPWPWLKMSFSDMPALLGGFAMGPVAGVLIVLIKNLLFLITGASTGGVIGVLADFLVGAALVIPAALIYRGNKTRKRALAGMAVGTVCMSAVAVVTNIYILIPMFSAHIDMSSFSLGTYILAGVTPFNLVKGILESLVTFLLYKPLSSILHR